MQQGNEPFGTPKPRICRMPGYHHRNPVASCRGFLAGKTDDFPTESGLERTSDCHRTSEQWPARGRRQKKCSHITVSVCDLVTPNCGRIFSRGRRVFFGGQRRTGGGAIDAQHEAGGTNAEHTNAEEPVDVDRGQVEGHLPTGSRARSAALETLVHTEKELPEPGPDQDAACRSAFSRLSPSAFAAAQVGPTPGIARNRVGPFGNTSRKASTIAKMLAEKKLIERRLISLHPAKTDRLKAHRPYPPVVPKFANPDDPRQVRSGRGKQPQWVTEKLASGLALEDLSIGRGSSVAIPKST